MSKIIKRTFQTTLSEDVIKVLKMASAELQVNVNDVIEALVAKAVISNPGLPYKGFKDALDYFKSMKDERDKITVIE
jgi:hypothetical protein